MTPTEQPTLRYCPFCGRKPSMCLTKVKSCQLHGEEYQNYYVKCGHCRFQMMESIESAAKREWNSRPIEDELRAENERLRSVLTRISKIDGDIISSTLAQEALAQKETKECPK